MSPEMAAALGAQIPNPNAGWMQPGAQPTGAVLASASAPFGAQPHPGYQQPQPAPAPPPPPAHPTGMQALGAMSSGQGLPRAVKWFSFPAEVWDAMPDVKPEHRRFAIKRLSVPEEARAQSNAQGTNFMAALAEMAKESIKKIGDLEATYDVREGMAVYGPGGWWQAIGPKGRRLVETAYVAVNQPEGSVGEAMVANAEDGWA